MAKLLQAIVAICKFFGLGKQEPAEAVFHGWEGLHKAIIEMGERVDAELAECKKDREKLHDEIYQCQRDRDRLNARLDDLESKIV